MAFLPVGWGVVQDVFTAFYHFLRLGYGLQVYVCLGGFAGAGSDVDYVTKLGSLYCKMLNYFGCCISKGICTTMKL